MNTCEYFKKSKRLVIKLGSSILTGLNGLDLNFIESISSQIANLIDNKKEIILVSSGAMSAGIRKLNMPKKPDELPKKQAIAAVGQAGLIMEYEKSFERHNKKVAQILLTSEDLVQRKRYLNARNTIYTLLSWGVLPIINENDTVSIEEIKFGDNDNLSAMIALLMDADLLINLTDIGGVYTKDPKANPDAELIPVINSINKDLEKITGMNTHGTLGTGGMFTKIKAAKKVTASGIPMLIANGREPEILNKLFELSTSQVKQHKLGTFFVPKARKLNHKKRWIGFTLKPKGILKIDDGAINAIINMGKSLLPSGIISIEGEFAIGSPVECRNKANEIICRGLVNYKSSDIQKIIGVKTSEIINHLGYKLYDEVIHRDNLVILSECSPPLRQGC